VKIEAAKKQLDQAARMFTEVMYDVGYNDTKPSVWCSRKLPGYRQLSTGTV
jgi:YesN/AraC family two-component response regulator